MIYDLWNFAKSEEMLKQTYITHSQWNNMSKVDEGRLASLVGISVNGYPDPCVIAFGYRKWNKNRGDMAGDWQHLFSFGTHNNNGGDIPTAPLAFYDTRNGIAGCTLNSTLPQHRYSIEDVWNKMYSYIIHKHDGLIDYYFDNILLGSISMSYVPNTFYFNGSGCGIEYYGVFSYLLIGDNLDDRLFNRYYPLYFNGKDIYAILKKDDSK